jgi:hypothetical protein
MNVEFVAQQEEIRQLQKLLRNGSKPTTINIPKKSTTPAEGEEVETSQSQQISINHKEIIILDGSDTLEAGKVAEAPKRHQAQRPQSADSQFAKPLTVNLRQSMTEPPDKRRKLDGVGQYLATIGVEERSAGHMHKSVSTKESCSTHIQDDDESTLPGPWIPVVTSSASAIATVSTSSAAENACLKSELEELRSQLFDKDTEIMRLQGSDSQKCTIKGHTDNSVELMNAQAEVGILKQQLEETGEKIRKLKEVLRVQSENMAIARELLQGVEMAAM